MGLLDRLRNAFERPVSPAGDPLRFAALRAMAYRELFGCDPIRVVPHAAFEKPPFGGLIDVHIYELPYQREDGQVQVAVTSGMSDYRMIHAVDRAPRRRELVQYFRDCKATDVVRLHDMAWLPLASRFCLDFFETAGPHPSPAWPNSLFVPPLVRSHAEFTLDLDGDEMQLLWHIPLSQDELAFKEKHGLDALFERMEARDLPWIFDESSRISLV